MGLKCKKDTDLGKYHQEERQANESITMFNSSNTTTVVATRYCTHPPITPKQQVNNSTFQLSSRTSESAHAGHNSDIKSTS
jgi:hypothetical protein